MPRTIRKYGWKRDIPDYRDYKLEFHSNLIANNPPSVDLRPQDSPIYDQGNAGSCTGNSTAGAIEFVRRKLGQKDFIPSRLFLYYNGRADEGSAGEDSGAQIRDVIKEAVNQGAPSETDWPYSDQLADVITKPSQKAYDDAKLDLVTIYQSLQQTLNQLKACLTTGFPFVFGFTVYSSFESAQVASTGIVPMPGGVFDQPVGGHAVMCVGYDDSIQRFIVRNSWGTSWGQMGYCTFPYNYMINPNLCSDFWAINAVTADQPIPLPVPTPIPTPIPTPTPIPPGPTPGPHSVTVLSNISVSGAPGKLVFIPN